MSARDDYPPHLVGTPLAAIDQWAEMCDEIDRLRSLVIRLGGQPQPGHVGPTVF